MSTTASKVQIDFTRLRSGNIRETCVWSGLTSSISKICHRENEMKLFSISLAKLHWGWFAREMQKCTVGKKIYSVFFSHAHSAALFITPSKKKSAVRSNFYILVHSFTYFFFYIYFFFALFLKLSHTNEHAFSLNLKSSLNSRWCVSAYPSCTSVFHTQNQFEVTDTR